MSDFEMGDWLGQSGPEQDYDDSYFPWRSIDNDLRHLGREGLGESRAEQGHNDDNSPQALLMDDYIDDIATND